MSPTDNLTINSKVLAKSLLLGIEHRGYDATGLAFIDDKHRFQIHKRDVEASKFVKRDLCLPRKATTAILHTRMWTQGKPEVNGNNHPIPQGTLVGVHNGWVTNDTDLWGKLVKYERRMAEVDSEVIFALLAHGLEDSNTNVLGALESIKANLAVAWLDREKPDTLFLARGHSSPLWLGQTEGGSLIFASEKTAVAEAADTAHLELTHLREVEEGNLFQVNSGSVDTVQTFTPLPPASYVRPSYSSWDEDTYDYHIMGHKPRFPGKVTTLVQPISDETGEADVDRRLFNPLYTPAPKPGASYSTETKRDSEINAWFDDFRGSAEALSQAAARLKAFIEVGDIVDLYLAGERTTAQVLLVPGFFPGGKYVLRAFVPAQFSGTTGKMECVLVERMWYEFHDAPDEQVPVRQSTAQPISVKV